MRFLLRYKYGMFQEKTERLYVRGIDSTDELLELVASKINFKSGDMILRYKSDREFSIKIIPGWPLSHYELKDGYELQVKVIEKEQQEQTNKYTNKYLMNLFGSRKEELSNVVQQDEKEQDQDKPYTKQVFSVRKYLDQQLEVLLKYVQKGKLSSMLKLIKEIPKDVDAEAADQIEQMKPKLVNELGQGGWGAIHYAVFCKQLQILKQLLRMHVDINKTTADGWSPLQLATNRRNLDQLKQLVCQQSIRVNQMTSRGTAMHIAAKGGFIEGIELLLQNNADFKLVDDKGKTALDYCEDPSCLRTLQIYQDKKSVRAESIPMEPIAHLAVLRGSLMKAKAVFMNLKERFLVLDPYEGTLIRYQDQKSYPKKPMQIIPLSSIKNIKILTGAEKTWPMKKELAYMEITCDKKLLFAAKHDEIMNFWFQGLLNSIQFQKDQETASIKIKTFLNEQSKNVLVLDDVSNKITPMSKKAHDKSSVSSSQFNKTIEENKKSTGSRNNQNHEPKMPVSVLSIASSQNHDSKTSFGSEVGSRKLIQRVSNQDEEDFKKLEDSFNKMNAKDKIQFSSFNLIRELGSGAFGKVFLAKLVSTGGLYALKALKKKNLILGKQKKFAIQEVNILKEVNHPFIINLNFAFQTPQYLYLALDYCSGKDLAFHLLIEGTFPESDTRFYIAELTLAIQHLHNKKILYRDLKPQNILLDHEGHIKLTDFGLSKSNVEDKAKSFVGTHAYISPDMLSGAGIDKEADIYGIGCIVYECLVGQPPFYSEDLSTLYQNIKEGKLKFPSSLSDPAKNLISALLQRDPKKRLGSGSMNQIKEHPFFKGLDWDLLLRRGISAPRRMHQEQGSEDEDDQLDMLGPKIKFNDADYINDNKINRFNGFSFAR